MFHNLLEVTFTEEGSVNTSQKLTQIHTGSIFQYFLALTEKAIPAILYIVKVLLLTEPSRCEREPSVRPKFAAVEGNFGPTALASSKRSSQKPVTSHIVGVAFRSVRRLTTKSASIFKARSQQCPIL